MVAASVVLVVLFSELRIPRIKQQRRNISWAENAKCNGAAIAVNSRATNKLKRPPSIASPALWSRIPYSCTSAQRLGQREPWVRPAAAVVHSASSIARR